MSKFNSRKRRKMLLKAKRKNKLLETKNQKQKYLKKALMMNKVKRLSTKFSLKKKKMRREYNSVKKNLQR